MQRSRTRDWVLGSLVLVALILWVHFAVGWGPLLSPWRQVSIGELLYLVGLSCASYLCRGVRLHVYFAELLRGRLGTTLRLSILHNVANNLLPMRSGEAVFPWLMKRYFGHGYLASSLSLLWIRLLDLHVIGLFALLAAWVAYPHNGWWAFACLWILLPPTAFVLGERLRTGLGEPQGRFATLVRQALDAAPTSARRFALVYLWTLLSWLSKMVAFVAIVTQFVEMPRWQAAFGVIGAELSSVLPFHGVAGSGSYELAMVAALSPFNVSVADGLRAAVNLHLFLLGVTLLLGAVAMMAPAGSVTVQDMRDN